jgi:NAD(P)-dependent dehydrogenase (short-subunit alcohol dehydrogenase family)
MTPVAVVTGAAGGIGEATAGVLADAGYSVALWDLDNRVADVAARIAGHGHTAIADQVDVADRASIMDALGRLKSSWGTPTAVVSAAGVMTVHPFLDLPMDSWERTLRVNLTGTFLLLQACGGSMVQDGLSGSMVAVASVAARGPRPDAADYAASKAGVVSVVQSAAVALAQHGIRVNALCPGVVNTPMTARNIVARASLEHVSEASIMASMVAKAAMNRPAEPAEVAATAVQLLGNGFGYVTGQAINVCGGLEFD